MVLANSQLSYTTYSQMTMALRKKDSLSARTAGSLASHTLYFAVIEGVAVATLVNDEYVDLRTSDNR